MPTTVKTVTFFTLLAASLCFFACKDDPETQTPKFAASLNGLSWEGDTKFIKATLTNGQIRITPTFCGITLFFDGKTAGTYSTGRDKFNYAIAQDKDCNDLFYTNLEDLNTGQLEITSIDTDKKLVSGKFSFTAKSKLGASLLVQDGVFENISYAEAQGNSNNKPIRVSIEENGKRYALNNVGDFSDYQLYASNNVDNKILTLIFPNTPFFSGTYDLAPLDVFDGKIRLVYNLIQSSTEISVYDPAPGSQLTMTVPAGSVTSFLGSFDVTLEKQGGTGPDTIQLKSEFEVYQ